MTASESIYLDLVRFLAALLVVFTHLIQHSLLPAYLVEYVPDLGREAVMIFFVLSGYVIAYSTDKKNYQLQQYIVARASRLYSVALPILLLAFGLDSIAIQFNPENYHHLYQYERFFIYIPLHLAFLGEVWTLAERPFTVPPYWSLSFEAWYYVAFACVIYYRGWRRMILVSFVALIVGYQHWILFPIWASGVVLYKCKDRYRLSRFTARLCMITSIFALVAMEITGFDIKLWQLGRDIWPFPTLPQGSTDQFLLDYTVCILVLVNFYCVRFADLNILARYEGTIRFLSSYTFTLYLIHTLVMFTWVRNFEYDNENILHLISLLCLIAIATLAVGEITEKRRSYFSLFFQYLVGNFAQIISKLPVVRHLFLKGSN